jgi:hypothetical protein
MVDQMEYTFEYGRELIDRELDVGIFDVVVKPIVKSFYKNWVDNEAREGTMKQIKVTLNVAKQLVKNGSEERFDELIEKNFQEYLSGDQTYMQCDKSHENFDRLKEITKQCFITQVKGAVRFFKIEKNVSDYDELTKVTFDTKEEAYDALSKQLDYNDKGIQIVEEDPSILEIPTGKKTIIKILRKGFEETKERLLNRLDRIYE